MHITFFLIEIILINPINGNKIRLQARQKFPKSKHKHTNFAHPLNPTRSASR